MWQLREFDEEETPDGSVGYKITVKGLSGGHSGMDIHKGLGNANKIMNRLLFDGFDNFGFKLPRFMVVAYAMRFRVLHK
jgi:dipeptidase D